MKAVRLQRYNEQPVVEEVAEPKITGPHDVIVRIGGAGLCRTDLHIIEGQFSEKSGVALPYTLGHENAGRVQEIGSAVSNVAVGDTVIVHPQISCGFCRACPLALICIVPVQRFRGWMSMVVWLSCSRPMRGLLSGWTAPWPLKTSRPWPMLA